MKIRVDDDDEFVTIIGGSLEELQRAYCVYDLGSRDFLILHKVARHRFIDVRGTESNIQQERLFAATYRRKTSTNYRRKES